MREKFIGTLGTYNSVQQNGNTYFTTGNPTMPFNACGMSFAELQAAGYEKGSAISSTLAIAMARTACGTKIKFYRASKLV